MAARIRIDFTDDRGFKRSDKTYQEAFRQMINQECPAELKSEIISNNAYFIDNVDEFEKHHIEARAHSKELRDKMESFLDGLAD